MPRSKSNARESYVWVRKIGRGWFVWLLITETILQMAGLLVLVVGAFLSKPKVIIAGMSCFALNIGLTLVGTFLLYRNTAAWFARTAAAIPCFIMRSNDASLTAPPTPG